MKNLPVYLLASLLLFHLFGNIIWIALNNAPPAWDQAYHTYRSLQFYSFFKSTFSPSLAITGFWAGFSDFYAPLVKMVTGLMLFFFSPNIKIAQFTGTIFFLGTLVAIYQLGKNIWGSPWVGLGGAFLFSFFQIIYDNSRWLLLDIPVTFFFLMFLNSFFKSDHFQEEKQTIYAFIWLSLAFLTKIQSLIYFVLPFLWSIFWLLKRKDYKSLPTIIAGALVFLTLTLPWLAASASNGLFSYLRTSSQAEVLADPTNIFNLTTWFHYTKLILNHVTAPFISLFLLPPLYLYLRTHDENKRYLLGLIAVYYVWYTLIPNKDLRFLFPIFPLMALVVAKGFWKLWQKNRLIFKSIIIPIVLFNLIFYFTLSFDFPFKKGIHKGVVLPIFGDIVYYNTTEYPVRAFDPRNWPNKEIIEEINNESSDQNASVLVLPNYEHFNDNNLKMLVKQTGYRQIQIVRADGRLKFEDASDIDNFLHDKNYILYTNSPVGPFYQLDKAAFDQLQVAIQQKWEKGEYLEITDYSLPTGEVISLLKKSSS